VADNSPIPLEPLTSYGKILRNTRLFLYHSDSIQRMSQDIIGWKYTSKQESIFPLLDKLWIILEDGTENIKTLLDSATKLSLIES
jgi:hypothetical protein